MPIHQKKKVMKTNQRLLEASTKFPIFDISYNLIKKKKLEKRPLYQALAKNQVFHQNPLLEGILRSKQSNGGVHDLKMV